MRASHRLSYNNKSYSGVAETPMLFSTLNSYPLSVFVSHSVFSLAELYFLFKSNIGITKRLISLSLCCRILFPVSEPCALLTKGDSIGPLDVFRHQNLSVHSVHSSLLDFGLTSPVWPVHKPVERHTHRLDIGNALYIGFCPNLIPNRIWNYWINCLHIIFSLKSNGFTSETGLEDIQAQQMLFKTGGTRNLDHF